MDYKNVLENQIRQLERVQEEVLKEIIKGEETTTYSQATLSLIASTALKIQSLVITANGL